MPLPPGTTLGPYKIVSLIGEGGMGEVYRARDTRLERDVAIKMLTAAISKDKEQLARFAQEARATGMLNHPNLLTIFDLGTAQGTPFLVSELLEGETLRDKLLATPRLPPRRAVEYTLQIAHGLAAAHDKGIVHRDLKPENIFIMRDGRVKILDFGIAKLAPGTLSEGSTSKLAATEPGIVLGTVGYMSPEQVRGENVDQRSDIFALGTILYEMLAGIRAFKRNSAIDTLSAILREEPTELLQLDPQLPQPLDRVVRRCLEKGRDLRFQNARDLAFHLESLTAISQGVPSQRSTPLPAMSGPVESRTAEKTGPTAIRPHVTAGTPTAGGTTPTSEPQKRPPTATMSARPRPLPQPLKKRAAVSQTLLVLLALVSVIGAAFGGYYLARREGSDAETRFRRMTFRRGEIRSARFSPAGDTVVYSAAWEGLPTELFVANRQSPESRVVGIPTAEVTGVSKSSELALILNRDRLSRLGTLARVPIVGGAPREVAENISHADWSPDGATLAVIRQTNGRYRVESPIGNVVYDTLHAIHDLRLSSDGRIAFVEPQAGANDITLIENGRAMTLARGWSNGALGLAWSPDAKELWFAGTDSGSPPALYAVDMKGDSRLVMRLPGAVRLHDIASDGSVLLSHDTWRAALMYQAPGETAERDVSWLDWSIIAELSSDGRTLLFNETREGGGLRSGIYVRRADAVTPVRIGDGYGSALSPDGKWVLAQQGAKLVLLPTGSGEPRPVPVDGAFDLGAAFFPDGNRVVIAGAQADKEYRLHILDVNTGALRPLSNEPVWGDAFRPFSVSPDGRWVAGMGTGPQLRLFPVEGGASVRVAAAEQGEIPVQWTADGAAIFVCNPRLTPLKVHRIELATGARTLWREFKPSDAAGVYKMTPFFMTPDGSAFAYNTLRSLSDLYVAEGLR